MSRKREEPDDGKQPPVLPTHDWGAPRRFAFRWVLIYFLLYTFPFPVSSVPNPAEWGWTAKWVEELQDVFAEIRERETIVAKFKERMVDLTADRVLMLAHEGELDRPLGSGDTTHNYIELLNFSVLATAGAMLWSILSFRRHYRWLGSWLHVGCRYYLAVTMLGYGMVKIVQLQFPEPRLDRLLIPYGDASPMNLLWTFMGYSQLYTAFAGGASCWDSCCCCFDARPPSARWWWPA